MVCLFGLLACSHRIALFSVHMFIELISVILPQCRQVFFFLGIRFVMPIIHSPDSSYRDVLLNSPLLSPSLSSSPPSCIFIMHYVDPWGICFEIVLSFEPRPFMVNWKKIMGLPCKKWWCRKQASCQLCPWLLTHSSLLLVHIHYLLNKLRLHGLHFSFIVMWVYDNWYGPEATFVSLCFMWH